MRTMKCNSLFLLCVSLALSCLCAGLAFSAEEFCLPCELKVGVDGTFSHQKENGPERIEGAGNNLEAFRESISGDSFAVTVQKLPAGRYTLVIGTVETEWERSGERSFSVACGDEVLESSFDIVAEAGAPWKVCYIIGETEHSDDTLRGPLKVLFKGIRGQAKFNTFEVLDESGETVLFFSASNIADPFSAAATRVPEIAEPSIWRNAEEPLPERINDLIRRMSLAEKVAQLQNDAPAIGRLGLPAYNYWNEALHGVANNGFATVFPEPVGMASTWNPALLHREGTVIGVEGRAKFNEYANQNNGDSKWWTGLTYWTPNINLFRDPRWGRGQETYGEDPFLAGEIAVEFIKGIQGDDPNYMLAMACAKHYAVHSGPEPDRHRFNAEPSERDLYEMYLPQFERAVREGGVAGVMSAYNAVDGIPCSASSFLLDDLLRKQWGFNGYVVSDCGGINDIWNPRAHHYVDSSEEAAALAVKAGCNLYCGGDYSALVRAVQMGLVSDMEIDRSLYYTLWTRFKLGLFDPPEKVPYSKYTIEDNDTPEHRELALEVARQSMVLLKNDGILPLDRALYKRIAVIGPNGASKSMLEGNYHGSASQPVSILDGIKELAGPDVDVTVALGSPVTTRPGQAAWSKQDNETDRPIPELKEEALALAKKADLVIYAGGITPAQEGEGFDRESIELPKEQEELIRALHALGKPMVMVNCSGSAIALTWEDLNLPAILQAWYPGEEGGRAVAEVLFGKVNPSGHLPLTFYRSTSDLPDFTDYSFKNRTYRYFTGTPLYAFGHGLSYTKFAYKNARLDSENMVADGEAKLILTVENTGDMAGADVIQVYVRNVHSCVEQPQQVLCGFQRVELDRGESKRVEIEIPASRLRYWDPTQKKYVVEPGEYEFRVGAASDDIRIKLPARIVD